MIIAIAIFPICKVWFLGDRCGCSSCSDSCSQLSSAAILLKVEVTPGCNRSRPGAKPHSLWGISRGSHPSIHVTWCPYTLWTSDGSVAVGIWLHLCRPRSWHELLVSNFTDTPDTSGTLIYSTWLCKMAPLKELLPGIKLALTTASHASRAFIIQ